MSTIHMDETISRMVDGKKGRSPKRSFENDENLNANSGMSNPVEEIVQKKAKTTTLSSDQAKFNVNATKTTTAAATRSALPRFSKTKTKPEPAAATRAKSPTPAAMQANSKPVAVPPTTPGKGLTSTAERGTDNKKPHAIETNNITTTQAAALTPKISTNPFLKKMQRELINEVSGRYFHNLFEQHITVLGTDDKLQATMNSLKSKTKWDKDRTKKLENALKEMKDIIVNLQDGVNRMKSESSTFETDIQSKLREVYDQFVDNIQVISSLQSNERKLKKENETLSYENKGLVTRVESLKNESQQQISKIEMSLVLQTKEKERYIEKIQDLESQLTKLNKIHEETLQQVRANSAQHTEEKMKVYQLEIQTLKSSLDKLQLDYHKLSLDNEELTKKNSNLHEEISELKVSLKNAEIARDMLDRDVMRLTQEVEHLKESLNKRDDDFRSSMTSAYSIQKQALEEKTALWHEINQLNNKAATLEEERRTLTSHLASQKEEIALLMKDYESLKDAKLHLEVQLQEKRGDSDKIKELSMQLEIEKELKIRFESREETERRERIAAVAQLIAIQNESNKLAKEMETKLKNLEIMKNEEIVKLDKEKESILAENKNNMEMNLGLKQEIQQLHYALEKAPLNHSFAEELSKAHGEIEILKQKLMESQSQQEKLMTIDSKRIQEYEDKLKVSENARRKLHNLVQELRGNIRVFARVRPFLPSDGHELSALPEPSILPRNDLNSLKIFRGNENNDRKEEYEFSFDKVFGPSISQETLFTEVAEFVQSALDGYHVCLFSYGQTGSGKTHTMNGSGDGSMRGIIPRAMEQVGAYKRQLQEKGWSYHMEISFIEIYNENIRDLLRTNNGKDGKEKDKDGEYSMKHDIKKDAQGNVYVTDINKIVVDPEDIQQIMSIMELAAQYRSTSSTLMNDRSSRSHAIFTLHLKAFNRVQGIELNGALNLVDLAGSERIDKSGVTGNELKEAVSINKSLSSLADVFNALANKQAHVPFRNSKLTYLLQPALSGDGKTLMIVNLSPSETSFYESLSSLRFASQVSQCELGKPKRKLRDVTSDSKEDGFAPNKRAMINTSSIPMVVNDTPKSGKHLTKASSFTIATATPPVQVEPKLGASLGAEVLSKGIADDNTSNEDDNCVPMEGVMVSSSNPSSRVNTPNKVRFGGVTSIKLPPSSANSTSAKSSKTSTGLTKTLKSTTALTPTKGKTGK